MSLERDVERLTSKIDEQDAPPTAGQAAMAGCLGASRTGRRASGPVAPLRCG